ncbi:MAG: alpha/beta fold hydrolase [Candidatus Binatia bacterium]|nr:alpha/beta fold hydrolase [Candidatus Binatia bacterium]
MVSCGDLAIDGAPTEIALQDVREEVRTFVDVRRSTPANEDFAGSSSRRLDTRLWYAERALRRPSCSGSRCALILLAHGFGGRTERFDAIGQRLAAAGYIIAAVSFPLTNQDAPGGFLNGGFDAGQQPADVSFVVDALLAASLAPADALYQRIDGAKVAAVGHSLGGTTVIAASRASCCRDTRLVATVYVEPATFAVEALFGESYSPSGPPTLTFQGTLDVPILAADTRAFHVGLEAPKILVEMVGGNHVNMIERLPTGPDPLLEEAAEMMIAFFDTYVVGGPDRVGEVAARLRASGHTVSVEGSG